MSGYTVIERKIVLVAMILTVLLRHLQNLLYSCFKSFLSEKSNVLCATVRAGNVIGGGDWTDARIVPDAVKAWSDNKSLCLDLLIPLGHGNMYLSLLVISVSQKAFDIPTVRW